MIKLQSAMDKKKRDKGSMECAGERMAERNGGLIFRAVW